MPGSASLVNTSASASIAASRVVANTPTVAPSPITTRNAPTSLVPMLRLLNQFMGSPAISGSVGALRGGARRARGVGRGGAGGLGARGGLALERELRDQLLELGGHAS